MLAARRGHEEIVQLFLDRGFSINFTDGVGTADV